METKLKAFNKHRYVDLFVYAKCSGCKRVGNRFHREQNQKIPGEINRNFRMLLLLLLTKRMQAAYRSPYTEA